MSARWLPLLDSIQEVTAVIVAMGARALTTTVRAIARVSRPTRAPPVAYRAYAKDANGSVIGLEKDDGTIAEDERYDYDPYGELDCKPAVNPDDLEEGLSPEAKANPFRFQGFYYDSGVKTYDMHAPQYRPETGRFLSRDSRFPAGRGA